jgi:hypothetical protein
MSNCRVCGGFASFYEDVRLCTHCRELESMAERVIHKNPEMARIFFRDLVIKAGQTLRAVHPLGGTERRNVQALRLK